MFLQWTLACNMRRLASLDGTRGTGGEVNEEERKKYGSGGPENEGNLGGGMNEPMCVWGGGMRLLTSKVTRILMLF